MALSKRPASSVQTRPQHSRPAEGEQKPISLGWSSNSKLGSAVLFGVLLWAFLNNLTELRSIDFWLHLQIARDVLADGLPQLDDYSATANGRPFIANGWLAALILYAAHAGGGIVGVVVLKAMLATAAFAVPFFAVDHKYRQQPLAIGFWIISGYVLFFRAVARPALFSLVMVALFVWLLRRWQTTRQRRYLAVLPVLSVLWVNLHAGASMGLAIAAATLVADCIARYRLSSAQEHRDRLNPVGHVGDLRFFALILAAIAAAQLVNPYGATLVDYTFQMSLASKEHLRGYAIEWFSLFSAGNWKPIWAKLSVVMLGLVMVAGIVAMRRRHYLNVLHATLAVGLGFLAIRFLPYLAIIGLPVLLEEIAGHKQALASDQKPTPGILSRSWPKVEAVWVAVLLVLVLRYGYAFTIHSARQIGVDIEPNRYPTGAVALLKEMNYHGAVFNEFMDGPYLIAHLYPAVRPAMDTRLDIYGEELINDWSQAMTSVRLFMDYVGKHEINAVVIGNMGGARRAIGRHLRKSSQWQRLPDNKRQVFIRVTPQ